VAVEGQHREQQEMLHIQGQTPCRTAMRRIVKNTPALKMILQAELQRVVILMRRRVAPSG
jgi:hypothetical protein